MAPKKRIGRLAVDGRAKNEREERLERIRQQIQSGELRIRQATPEERRTWPFGRAA